MPEHAEKDKVEVSDFSGVGHTIVHFCDEELPALWDEAEPDFDLCGGVLGCDAALLIADLDTKVVDFETQLVRYLLNKPQRTMLPIPLLLLTNNINLQFRAPHLHPIPQKRPKNLRILKNPLNFPLYFPTHFQSRLIFRNVRLDVGGKIDDLVVEADDGIGDVAGLGA